MFLLISDDMDVLNEDVNNSLQVCVTLIFTFVLFWGVFKSWIHHKLIVSVSYILILLNNSVKAFSTEGLRAPYKRT